MCCNLHNIGIPELHRILKKMLSVQVYAMPLGIIRIAYIPHCVYTSRAFVLHAKRRE